MKSHECPICYALVTDLEKHIAWHDKVPTARPTLKFRLPKGYLDEEPEDEY